MIGLKELSTYASLLYLPKSFLNSVKSMSPSEISEGSTPSFLTKTIFSTLHKVIPSIIVSDGSVNLISKYCVS